MVSSLKIRLNVHTMPPPVIYVIIDRPFKFAHLLFNMGITALFYDTKWSEYEKLIDLNAV